MRNARPSEVDWGIVSLFSMGDCAEHITLEGLQYPLTDGTIDCGFPPGVSNHIIVVGAHHRGRGPLLVGWELREEIGRGGSEILAPRERQSRPLGGILSDGGRIEPSKD